LEIITSQQAKIISKLKNKNYLTIHKSSKSYWSCNYSAKKKKIIQIKIKRLFRQVDQQLKKKHLKLGKIEIHDIRKKDANFKLKICGEDQKQSNEGFLYFIDQCNISDSLYNRIKNNFGVDIPSINKIKELP